jgi:hypothetical protein
MSDCLAAKALALAATVLGRPASDQQPDADHDEDGNDNGDCGSSGHPPLSTRPHTSQCSPDPASQPL